MKRGSDNNNKHQVTTAVRSEDCPVVARTGKWSIFAALQECCPSAVRNEDPYIGKFGMTEIELNKVLEKNNFVKIRDRSNSGGACEQEVNACPQHISRCFCSLPFWSSKSRAVKDVI